MRIETALAGPVGGSIASSRLTMLGQNAVTNAGTASGPITQYRGGYANAADARAGDSVEVHDLLLPRTIGYVFQTSWQQRPPPCA